MKRNGNHSPAFSIGIAAGFVGGVLLGRKLASPPRPPYLFKWQRALEPRVGSTRAAQLAARIQQRYERFYKTRPRFSHPALRFHLEKNILPGLALYQTLSETYADRETALQQTQNLIELTVWQTRMIPWIQRLPGSFTAFRWIVRMEMSLLYPRAGWRLRWLQDDDTAIDFHIYRCFYLDTLKRYGVPELTPLFCRLDDILGEAMAPAIQWRRLKTLGRGDDVCDFCFRNNILSKRV